MHLGSSSFDGTNFSKPGHFLEKFDAPVSSASLRSQDAFSTFQLVPSSTATNDGTNEMAKEAGGALV